MEYHEIGIDNVDGFFYATYYANSDKIYISTLIETSPTELRNATIELRNTKNYEHIYATCINLQTGKNTHEISGIIKAPDYTIDGPLGYISYNGPRFDESQYSETSRALVAITIIGFNNFLLMNVPGINIYDFGFTSYK